MTAHRYAAAEPPDFHEQPSASLLPRARGIGVAWSGRDMMKDPTVWTVALTPSDRAELDRALAAAKASRRPLAQITRAEFPLEDLAAKLETIEKELHDGRGFALLRKLDPERYGPEDLMLMFWGIGIHLGIPWPQNKYGELIADVMDRGTNEDDPGRRADERGGIAFEHHTDSGDIVGLLCLATAQSGGISCLANTIAVYDDLCATRPDVIRVLKQELPFDFRGENPEGREPFYMSPVFTEVHGRLFVRFIAEYIRSSQRHAEAPRLTPSMLEAMQVLSATSAQRRYNVYMTFEPGDMQFINNYHVMHGRTAYVDAPELGRKRHLKRLWLGSPRIVERPATFRREATDFWERNPVPRRGR